MNLIANRQSWVTTEDGVDLSIREWGDPNGPEVLLVHGQAQCHLCFAPQLDSALARECRVVAFDLRGHGESGKPPGQAPYRDAARFGADIASVIEAAGLRRPVAVGWSMGGRSLREYLKLHGDARLSGINFVASRVIESEPAGRPNLAWLTDTDLATKIEATARFLRTCYLRPPEGEAFAFALAYNMLLPFEAREGIAHWAVDRAGAEAAVRALRVPVLVSQGRQDAIVPEAASRRVAEVAPNAQLSLYDACGHSPFYEHAARFTDELERFVRSAWSI